MEKPQPLLRKLHPCGPNCELLNRVGEDLANLRELVPKLGALRLENPGDIHWDARHTEALAMLVEYEVRYTSMVDVRQKALRKFHRLRPDLKSRSPQKPLKPEIEQKFQSLLDELEDLVFELAVTDETHKSKAIELNTLVESLTAQIQVVSSDLGLDKGSAAIREAAMQMAKQLDDAQTAVEESKAKSSKG